MSMEQYLDKVSLERIVEIRLKIAERAARVSYKGESKKCDRNSSSELEDASFREENWEFLMIHTSKKAIDDTLPQV